MKKILIKTICYIIIVALAAPLAHAAQTTTPYPAKSIRFVVGFPPGGGNDAMARLFGQRYAKRFGQSVVIDNRPGAGGNLAGELFRYVTGVELVHIPYKGTAQATTDLMSGRVQLMFTPTLAVAQYVQAGRLRALGVTSAKRSRVMPDLPTLAEAGATGYEFGAWYGILAPARLPADIVNKLHAESQRALQAQEIKDRLTTEDLDPANATPAQLDDIRKAELAKWTKIVKQLGLQFE